MSYLFMSLIYNYQVNKYTVNSRYNQVGYNEITAYNEMEIFPQSTKCINY